MMSQISKKSEPPVLPRLGRTLRRRCAAAASPLHRLAAAAAAAAAAGSRPSARWLRPTARTRPCGNGGGGGSGGWRAKWRWWRRRRCLQRKRALRCAPPVSERPPPLSVSPLLSLSLYICRALPLPPCRQPRRPHGCQCARLNTPRNGRHNHTHHTTGPRVVKRRRRRARDPPPASAAPYPRPDIEGDERRGRQRLREQHASQRDTGCRGGMSCAACVALHCIALHCMRGTRRAPSRRRAGGE